jgi:hypothetical protein
MSKYRHIATRPVPPGRLAVRTDWTRTKGLRWAIVSNEPIHPRHGLVGHQRGFGESHAGLWAYSFISQRKATQTALEILASGHSVWAAR